MKKLNSARELGTIVHSKKDRFRRLKLRMFDYLEDEDIEAPIQNII